MIAPNLGSEFVPRLSEGAIVINVVRLAGTDIDESIRTNTLMERAVLRAFPDEVEHVWSRIGTAEIATDPMGVELTDLFITLKPRSPLEEGRHAGRTDRADRQGAAGNPRPAPGLHAADRNADQRDGLRRANGRGGEGLRRRFLDARSPKANEIEQVLRTRSPATPIWPSSRSSASRCSKSRSSQDEIARYGVPAKAVLDLVESIGSKPLGEIVEGQLRFPLVVRLPERYRGQPGGHRQHPAGHRRRASGFRSAGWRRCAWWKARPRSRGSGASGGSP